MEKAFIECVINISEGRDANKIARLIDIFSNADKVTLAHKDVGFDANRTVFTLLGEPKDIFTALEKVIAYAKCAFDIRLHKGTHPRIGILDVIPFIPIEGIAKATLEKRVKRFSSEVGLKYNLPILYYGSLSKRANQKSLHQLRRENINQTLGKTIISDCGPQNPHPELGASCVTVRDFMVAYNINLRTQDLVASKNLARRLLNLRKTKQSSKDLSQVKFLAWHVEEYGCCQISTNIYDIDAITMLELYETVATQASLLDIGLNGSELIGMTPWRGITREKNKREDALDTLRLDSVRPFQKEAQVIEYFIERKSH